MRSNNTKKTENNWVIKIKQNKINFKVGFKIGWFVDEIDIQCQYCELR
jgi:hypothetical protein